jgi:hypothetical protein
MHNEEVIWASLLSNTDIEFQCNVVYGFYAKHCFTDLILICIGAV